MAGLVSNLRRAAATVGKKVKTYFKERQDAKEKAWKDAAQGTGAFDFRTNEEKAKESLDPAYRKRKAERLKAIMAK